MIDFVGAGPGAKDLITVRGMELIKNADVIIYAGSLVNPELLSYAKPEAVIYNSAKMTLEEVMEVMIASDKEGKNIVRLHTGDPSIYGAIREQMDILDEKGIKYKSCPGVSALFGASSSLDLEYTLPGISQSLIITRMKGRTDVPEKESIESFAAHRATMAIYLSAGQLQELSERLVQKQRRQKTAGSQDCLEGQIRNQVRNELNVQEPHGRQDHDPAVEKRESGSRSGQDERFLRFLQQRAGNERIHHPPKPLSRREVGVKRAHIGRIQQQIDRHDHERLSEAQTFRVEQDQKDRQLNIGKEGKQLLLMKQDRREKRHDAELAHRNDRFPLPVHDQGRIRIGCIFKIGRQIVVFTGIGIFIQDLLSERSRRDHDDQYDRYDNGNDLFLHGIRLRRSLF